MAKTITPNVITEAALKALVTQGCSINIACKEDALRKGPSWYGLWTVSVEDQQGNVRQLVISRPSSTTGDVHVREFKTLTGLVSFLVGLGFERVDVPLRA